MVHSIRDQVLEVLRQRFDIDPTRVTDTSDLRGELDLDSIDLFDMMGVIEKQGGLSADISDFAHAKTFGDLIKTLERISATENAA